ncbi:hypothetical protein Tco_1006204 [Tanacetum coccineum]|uniref:Reverse transcriptase domain-containing protein n=1 Tax=Tanacetum coccineum TaxID=301880 RepID=A0ABQ5FHF1_9ASTR
MAPKRTTISTPAITTTPTTFVTDEQLKRLIDQGIADALVARDADKSRNGEDSHDSSTGVRRQAPPARECTYPDIMKCKPLYFKGTEGAVELTYALTWWNSYVKTVGHDVAYAMTWTNLKKKMTDKYCPTGEVKKHEGKMWNLKVKGTDVGTITKLNPKSPNTKIKQQASKTSNEIPQGILLMDIELYDVNILLTYPDLASSIVIYQHPILNPESLLPAKQLTYLRPNQMVPPMLGHTTPGSLHGQTLVHASTTQNVTQKGQRLHRMFPEESDKIEKYVGGLPDMIHESVMASKPKTMQDAIEFATEPMDKKIRTFAERQSENKRNQDDNQQQQQNKRQNTGRVYAAGSGEKKPYGGSTHLCSKCNYHHDGQCAPKCHKCNRVCHLACDYRTTANANTANNQRGTGAGQKPACYECGA